MVRDQLIAVGGDADTGVPSWLLHNSSSAWNVHVLRFRCGAGTPILLAPSGLGQSTRLGAEANPFRGPEGTQKQFFYGRPRRSERKGNLPLKAAAKRRLRFGRTPSVFRPAVSCNQSRSDNVPGELPEGPLIPHCNLIISIHPAHETKYQIVVFADFSASLDGWASLARGRVRKDCCKFVRRLIGRDQQPALHGLLEVQIRRRLMGATGCTPSIRKFVVPPF